MLKIIGLSKESVLIAFRTNNNEVVRNGDSKANKMIINLFNKLKNNKSKKLMRVLNIGAMEKPIFLTFNTKKAFNYLKQAFIKTAIL